MPLSQQYHKRKLKLFPRTPKHLIFFYLYRAFCARLSFRISLVE